MVEKWVKDISESVLGGAPFAIGDIVRHHPSGRLVQITGGQYWGKHGLSNFWNWREVDKNGTVVGPDEGGYGWRVRE